MDTRACKRKPNFTESENVFLVQEFEKHRDILNSKLTSMETNRGKQSVWQEICIGLNRINSNQGKGERTVKEIRRKWKNMVTSAKRHAKQLKSSHKEATGRPLKPLSALSQKIIEMKSETSEDPEHADDGTVIVEIKTEQEDGGVCTESISKKGPLEVFFSSESAVVAQSDEESGASPSPCGTDAASFSESCSVSTSRVGGGTCEPGETPEECGGLSGQTRKRSAGVYTNSEQLRKRSRTQTHTSDEDDLCKLKREKLLLQIEKLKSEKDKLDMEKERLALEIQFWKTKIQSTE